MPDAGTLQERRQAFCDGLKAARKRRGIAITAIAETTKVCPTYFVALERNDLSLWPKGLFRRSFFRAYVGMIGLPVTETLEEFIQLFPDDERPAAAAAQAAAPTQEFRLALDDTWHGSSAPLGRRLAVAALDTLVVLILAAGFAWLTALSFVTVLAVAAMTYFTLAAALLGETLAVACLRWTPLIADGLMPAPAGAVPETVDPQQAQDDRAWITDARRVRPRSDPPRLRVRFKLSS